MYGREEDCLRHLLEVFKRDKRRCKKREDILREVGGRFGYIKELQMEKKKGWGSVK